MQGQILWWGSNCGGGNFTRGTLVWGQFYSGAIVWGSGWQLSRRQFSSGAIALEPVALPRWDDFIPRSYGIFYLSLFNQKVCYITGKDCFDHAVFKHFKNKQWPRTMRNKLQQKFSSFIQKKCSYFIELTSEKTD